MAEYTFLQERIFMVISEMHPFTIDEVKMVYDRCKSIDTTIYLLEKKRQLATPLDTLLEIAGY